jgi:hypothetical protein
MLRWQSRRAFAPAKETVGRQGLRLCRVPRLAVPPVIPNKINRRKSYPHNKRVYRHRNKVERLFCRLKDARRIATRDENCANTFLSAVCLVALLSFWLNSVWTLVRQPAEVDADEQKNSHQAPVDNKGPCRKAFKNSQQSPDRGKGRKRRN